MTWGPTDKTCMTPLWADKDARKAWGDDVGACMCIITSLEICSLGSQDFYLHEHDVIKCKQDGENKYDEKQAEVALRIGTRAFAIHNIWNGFPSRTLTKLVKEFSLFRLNDTVWLVSAASPIRLGCRSQKNRGWRYVALCCRLNRSLLEHTTSELFILCG